MIRGNGVGVSRDWIRQCIEYLSRTGPVPRDEKALAEKVYALFLDSDLHEISSKDGVLPSNVSSMHKTPIGQGIMVLQVDEVVNVGASATTASNQADDDEDDRANNKAPAVAAAVASAIAGAEAAVQNAASSTSSRLPAVPAGNRRFLKLYLTDGRQKVGHHRRRENSPLSQLCLNVSMC